jgi:hypothetical protein
LIGGGNGPSAQGEMLMRNLDATGKSFAAKVQELPEGTATRSSGLMYNAQGRHEQILYGLHVSASLSCARGYIALNPAFKLGTPWLLAADIMGKNLF